MSPKKIYRVGVIGGGAIAQTCHIPGYARDARANLVAVADPNPARHKEIRSRFGDVTAYASYRDMLAKEKLDVVSVCTPNAYHTEHTLAALRHGCHVLCEKPMATTLPQANRMIAAAKKARKKLMIGFTHRLYSGPERTKALLKEKAIGKPFMIRVRFAHTGPYPDWGKGPWFYDPKLSAGGALMDMGIHAIDLAHWLIGPIAAVSARVDTLVKRIPVDDCAVLILEFANGAMGYIEVGWSSQPGFSGIEIYGTKGTIICDYANGLRMLNGKGLATRPPKWKVLDADPTVGGWDVEIQHWLDVVSGKTRSTMTGQVGKDALKVALAAYTSSKTGRRVRLRSPR
ncbi:MAG: Gfo/Idh/MocA family oxidoreductase [Candidatus Hydrogenedentes bacterium]|nr:Gfo/Idh/MocA family oxidoreductase [Candidatus Hydrogenedentota bacterium]